MSATPLSLFSGLHRRGIFNSCVIKGLLIAAACLLLILIALFVWPGFAWLIPVHYGVVLLGDLDYILSEDHLNAVQIGMTLGEVQAALDVAQQHRPPRRWETNAQESGEIGKLNVNLFQSTRERLPQSREVRFIVGGERQHELELRIRDDIVVAKTVRWNEDHRERERSQKAEHAVP